MEVKMLLCQLEEECVHTKNMEHLIFMFVESILSSGDRRSDFVQGAGHLGGIHIDTIKARKKINIKKVFSNIFSSK